MSDKGRAAVASTQRAREIAEARLAASGAVEAALAGWFALAASTPWGLFASVTFVVAGGGAGVTFVDGRPRQPGRGKDRPRRYDSAVDAPPGAFAAAPGSIPAAAAVSALFGVTMAKGASAGVEVARELGEDARAKLFQRVGTLGVRALVDRAFLAALEQTVPAIEGHPLGRLDFEDPPADIVASGVASGDEVRAPWADAAARALGTGRETLAVLAVDRRGTLAGAIVEAPPSELALADGSVSLPLSAMPLLRGVTRPKPGTPLPSAVPLVVSTVGGRAASVTAGELGVGWVQETHAAWSRG